LTSEFDENNPKTAADIGPTKNNTPTNINRMKNANLTNGEEEIDFDGLTNPSVHKISNNDFGGFEETAYATNNSKNSRPA
jgi:hypothetical protein